MLEKFYAFPPPDNKFTWVTIISYFWFIEEWKAVDAFSVCWLLFFCKIQSETLLGSYCLGRSPRISFRTARTVQRWYMSITTNPISPHFQKIKSSTGKVLLLRTFQLVFKLSFCPHYLFQVKIDACRNQMLVGSTWLSLIWVCQSQTSALKFNIYLRLLLSLENGVNLGLYILLQISQSPILTYINRNDWNGFTSTSVLRLSITFHGII